MTVLVVRGDAARLPLPDASVDLVVTSPPYYGLRSYTDGGQHYPGQIGSEATPADYIAALIACTREWVRVLKPSGSLFVNLGDRYAGGGMGGHVGGNLAGGAAKDGYLGYGYQRPQSDVRDKSLMGLPWRYALAATDQLQLILRAEIIWNKPNGLPESVTDRVRRSHEQWFHLVRQPRYYSAVDEIREPHADASLARYGRKIQQQEYSRANGFSYAADSVDPNPLGKLPGSVWTIPSQPLTVPPELGVDHFAAFPMEWPRRIINGWSPPGICVGCGEGLRPVVEGGRNGDGAKPHKAAMRIASFDWAAWKECEPHRITGYTCGCPEPPRHQHYTSLGAVTCHVPDCDVYQIQRQRQVRPAVVVDPFGGTGTTALLAHTLSRTGITVDRSADYSRLAQWRTHDPAQRAAALQVDKPPAQIDGQLTFEETAP